ncbi:MAG TPA: 6,7-dimethyl-8-ribityllumazine synthase [Pirellulales bacterium]|jgi:6,7-dimethyl-8-ribityllumazine synthase
MTTFHSDLSGANGQYAIVVSRYNEKITSKLLEGAVATLKAAGVEETAIDVAWVPGAFEIPLAADKMAGSRRYSAVLCLGAVIRGETSHDQHINRAVSAGIMEANLKHGIPILFGVLTCDTVEQAIRRAGGNVDSQDEVTRQSTKPIVGNKGVECATAALEMVSLLKNLRRRS